MTSSDSQEAVLIARYASIAFLDITLSQSVSWFGDWSDVLHRFGLLTSLDTEDLM